MRISVPLQHVSSCSRDECARDLFGGVYGQGNIRPRGTTVRPGRRVHAKFHFTRLPAPGRTVCDHWSFEDIRVPHGVRDFSFDPALDLMLLIEARSWPLSVHIRHLSTNEPHSQAVHPIFEYTRQTNVTGPPPTHESFYIQIMGEHFAVLRLPSHQIFGLIPAENEIVVGNWRTGHVITTLMLPEFVMQTFCFISPCHFVIGVGDKDQHSNAGLSARPRLQVYKFDPLGRAGDPPLAPTLTCELHLPALAPGYFCDQLLTRSDPAPGINMAKAHSRAFAQGPDDRLLVVTVPIRKIDRQQLIMSDVLQVFVRMSSLLEFSAVYEHDLDDNGPPPTTFSVFWEGWNTHARALSVTFWEWERTWVCYVYGLRFIYALHLDGDDPRDDPEDRRICLMDFNQLNVRRVANRRGVQEVTEATEATAPAVPVERSDEDIVEDLLGSVDNMSIDEPAEPESDLMVEDEDADDRARGWVDVEEDEDEGQSHGPPGETQVLIHLEESVHEKECYIGEQFEALRILS